MTNDGTPPPACATCYWFIRINETPRCCCASSSMSGNTNPQLTCQKWQKKFNTPPPRSSVLHLCRVPAAPQEIT